LSIGTSGVWRERQGKFRAKLLERHFSFACLRENKIRGFQDGGQIVNQRAGPVEDDVADHETNLTTKHTKHTKLFANENDDLLSKLET
jgi:hypothetical protein